MELDRISNSSGKFDWPTFFAWVVGVVLKFSLDLMPLLELANKVIQLIGGLVLVGYTAHQWWRFSQKKGKQ